MKTVYTFGLLGIACVWGEPHFTLFDASADGSPLAEISTAAAVRVRFSVAGESTPCWAVTATVDGAVRKGYLTDRHHPAIEVFERDTSSRIPSIPAPPPPPPPVETPVAVAEPVAAKVMEKPLPTSFGGFLGVDLSGRRIDLDRMKAKTVVLYFWSPDSKRALKDMDSVAYIHEQYASMGVEVIGVATSSSAGKVRQVCNQNEAVWTQVLDPSGALAQEHNVDPTRPYLVLDRNRDVVASFSHASDLDPILQKRIH